MKANDEHSDAQRSSEAATNGTARDGSAAAAERLRDEFRLAFAALRRSFYAERQAFGLTLFDFALRACLFACLGIAGLALSGAAALLGVAAARRGLDLLSGGAWWSDLVLAVVLVGVVAGAAWGVRRAVHRSVLQRARRHLARDGSPPVAREPGR